MILSRYDADSLGEAFGIDAGPIPGPGAGAAWARVPPGGVSQPHQHDETETFVIIRGEGVVVADGERYPVSPGTVARFEPFETHLIENGGQHDLVFATFCWRDPECAIAEASRPGRRRFGERPIFVYSTPPTPNGDLHLGHLCGPYLGADAFVRFQRMNGASAWHITGTDDFQSYVAECARREGREPAQTAATFSTEIAETLRLMDIVPDQFTATSAAPGYEPSVRAFFSRLVASGRVTPADLPALFDAESGAYLFEVELTGRCPGCDNSAAGNICEECGEPNSCADLVDARATRSGLPPRAGSCTSFRVPLHEFRDAVAQHHRLGRVPARIRQVADRVCSHPGLDVRITHPVPWGIQPAEPGAGGQKMWAIVDVAYSLLYGIESLGRRLGHDWRAGAPQPDWKIVQFFGFDNTFYNSIFVPLLYHIAYPGWTPDIDYHVNEFYGLEGSKFSTSRHHVIWGKEILSPHSADAVRLYLSLTRPEGRRTNFVREEYEAFLQDTLIGGWQCWLNDLGDRIERHYGGAAPDAGVWTPEHTAFAARLHARLSALTGCLGPDGFSLNQAAAELLGIVADTTRFAQAEAATAESARWHDEARTAVALELAAARLLASCAAPLMPRFAAQLATALPADGAAQWPRTVMPVRPGAPVNLARQVFFGAAGGAPRPVAAGTVTGPGNGPALLPWLEQAIRGVLGLTGAEPLASHKLPELGMASLQAVSLQYQIFDQIGVEVSIQDLLGDRDVASLASWLAEQTASQVVLAAGEDGRI